MVGDGVRPRGGDDSDGDADDHGDRGGYEGQLEGGAHPGTDLGDDGPVRADGPAEVEAHHASDPAQVTRRGGLVQAEPFAQLLTLSFRGALDRTSTRLNSSHVATS